MGLLLEAISIGIIFQRFSRAQARANTIVLSTNAVVRRIRGELYFMFQVCEMRKHQLVEAHVRMYAIRHDVEFGQHYYFQSHPMRIQHPDDDLGGMLLLALPSVVVHRMDAWSPLCRPKSRASCGLHHHPAKGYMFPEVISRQADLDSGDRDGLVPLPADEKPKLCTPCRCSSAPVSSDPASHEAALSDIKEFWKDSQVGSPLLLRWCTLVSQTAWLVWRRRLTSSLCVQTGGSGGAGGGHRRRDVVDDPSAPLVQGGGDSVRPALRELRGRGPGDRRRGRGLSPFSRDAPGGPRVREGVGWVLLIGCKRRNKEKGEGSAAGMGV